MSILDMEFSLAKSNFPATMSKNPVSCVACLPRPISRPPALAAEPQFDPGALATLEGMGFPIMRCKKALLATGNGNDAEAAMEWLFAHMDDPGGDGFHACAGAQGIARDCTPHFLCCGLLRSSS
jgi:hypothetical protein